MKASNSTSRGPNAWLVAVLFLGSSLGASAQSVDGVASVGETRVLVSTVAEGLNRPWGLAFLPNGDLLVTEKNGGLHRIPKGQSVAIPIAGLPRDIDRRLESPIDNTGLFDIAVAKDYAKTGHVFIAYAKTVDGGAVTAVERFVLRDDRLDDARMILRAGPSSRDRFHYGGALLTMDDGTLLVTSGERFAFEAPQLDAPVAQDTMDLRGKILRIDRDGAAPKDNPHAGDTLVDARIFASGIRNSQGMTLDGRGRVWFGDHGPRSGDELNLLTPGGNYGWPQQTCGEYKDRDYVPPRRSVPMTAPSICWSTITIAPSGLAYYGEGPITALKDSLLVAGLSTGNLLQIPISEDGTLGEPIRLFEDDPQRLRDVAVGPDGVLYLAVDGESGRVVRVSVGDAP